MKQNLVDTLLHFPGDGQTSRNCPYSHTSTLLITQTFWEDSLRIYQWISKMNASTFTFNNAPYEHLL